MNEDNVLGICFETTKSPGHSEYFVVCFGHCTNADAGRKLLPTSVKISGY